MTAASATPAPPAAELLPDAPVAAAADPGFTVDASRLRAWGLMSAFALLDQGLFSGAGFLVNLLLARWLAPASYGAFAVAFAVFLFIAGFHNVLLLEPLTVMGPGRHSGNLPSYFRAQLAIHFVLVGGLALAGVLAGLVAWRMAPGSPLVGAIFGSALMLPLLLLLWLARRMCYVHHRPGVAVAGSGAYLVLIIAGLAALHHFGWATPFLAFLLMGVGSLIASGVLLAQFGSSRPSEQLASISWRTALRENWGYGRWLMGSTVLFSATSQVQVFFVSGLLGLGAAGVLRAVQIPSLVMMQVMAAAGLLVLPAFSQDYACGAIRRLRHKAVATSLSLAAVALLLAGLTWFLNGPLERLLFGGKFASYAGLMPIFVLMTAVVGLSQGFGLALRAARMPHFDLISNSFAAPVAVASAYFFTKWWELTGAAVSVTTAFAVQCAVTIVCFYVLLPKRTEAECLGSTQRSAGVPQTGDARESY